MKFTTNFEGTHLKKKLSVFINPTPESRSLKQIFNRPTSMTFQTYA